MRVLVLIVLLLISFPLLSQETEKNSFFKGLFQDFLKFDLNYTFK